MYHIIEIQTFQSGESVIVHDSSGAIPQAADKKEALALYHEKMAYAERSGLPVHAVVVIDEKGNALCREFCTPEGGSSQDDE